MKYQEKEIVSRLLELLNSLTGSKFKASSGTTTSHVNARLGEGYTVEDMALVVEHKVSEWLGDAKLAAYLRPETLFGHPTKIEGYVMAARRWEAAGRPKRRTSEEERRAASTTAAPADDSVMNFAKLVAGARTQFFKDNGRVMTPAEEAEAKKRIREAGN